MSASLTDAQRMILAAAAARDDRLAFPFPRGIKVAKDKLAQQVHKLIDNGFLVAQTVGLGDPYYGTDDTDTPFTLVISASGLRQIGVEPQQDGTSSDHIDEPASEPKQKRNQASTSSRQSHKEGTTKTPSSPKKTGAPRAPTKLSIVLTALKGRKGATVEELMELTGWQAHSVRGAMSGALKKKLELTIDSKLVEGRGRVYRIAG